MKLEYLADNEEFIPLLANWYFEEWGCKKEGNTPEKEINKLHIYLNKGKMPLILIATEENELLGAAQLKFREMSIYPEKEHWLGGVYVSRHHRGNGIARQIIEEIISIAEKLQIKKLYLQTEKLDGGLYRRMGWKAITQVHYQNNEVLVMERKIS